MTFFIEEVIVYNRMKYTLEEIRIMARKYHTKCQTGMTVFESMRETLNESRIPTRIEGSVAVAIKNYRSITIISSKGLLFPIKIFYKHGFPGRFTEMSLPNGDR